MKNTEFGLMLSGFRAEHLDAGEVKSSHNLVVLHKKLVKEMAAMGKLAGIKDIAFYEVIAEEKDLSQDRKEEIETLSEALEVWGQLVDRVRTIHGANQLVNVAWDAMKEEALGQAFRSHVARQILDVMHEAMDEEPTRVERHSMILRDIMAADIHPIPKGQAVMMMGKIIEHYVSGKKRQD